MHVPAQREAALKTALVVHLRVVGFPTEVEAYLFGTDVRRRLDFAVFLPVSARFLFLECKRINPRGGYKAAFSDISKLLKTRHPKNRLNGLICLGFRDPPVRGRDGFPDKYRRLSKEITSKWPYAKVGVEKVDLPGLEENMPYAMVGLWIRKSGADTVT
jgi:hypothetical protein